MKKNILLIALSFALSTINAQNIQTVGISFTQTLFPKKTLPANIKNYAVTITTPYLKDDSTFRKIAEDKYQEDLKNYPNVVAEAKKKFNEVDLVNHNIKVIFLFLDINWDICTSTRYIELDWFCVILIFKKQC